MLISRIAGRAYRDSDAYNGDLGDKVEEIFEADGAIAVGAAVQLDYTGNTSGNLVISTLDGEYKAFVGVYEGTGGTGTSSAAQDGDVIYVTVHGPASALVSGDTLTVAVGHGLTAKGDAGGLVPVADTTYGVMESVAVPLQVGQTTANVLSSVFIKAM